MSKEKKQKRIKLNVREFNQLLNNAEVGEDVKLFTGMVDMERLRNSFIKVANHYLFAPTNETELTPDEIDDLRLLSSFLQQIA